MRNLWVRVLVIMGLVLIATPASAEILEEHWKRKAAESKSDQEYVASPFLDRELTNEEEWVGIQTWEFGTEISHIHYEEPGVMEEKGIMYGVVGSYTYRSPFGEIGSVMLRGEGKFSYGQVDYSSPASGTLDDIEDYMLEFRALGGYDFIVSESVAITPYFGFGYRYLNDDSSGMVSSRGFLGYERESNYFYSPVGLETHVRLPRGWLVRVIGEYDIFWTGVQKSNLSDVIVGLNDLSNRQSDGYGVRGSLRLQKSFKDFGLIIEPFVRYWDIEQSDIKPITFFGTIEGFGFEPANESTEIGAKVAVDF